MINASFLVDDSLWMKSSQPFILILLEEPRDVPWLLFNRMFCSWGFFSLVGCFFCFVFSKKIKSEKLWRWANALHEFLNIYKFLWQVVFLIFDYLQFLWELISSFKVIQLEGKFYTTNSLEGNCSDTKERKLWVSQYARQSKKEEHLPQHSFLSLNPIKNPPRDEAFSVWKSWLT